MSYLLDVNVLVAWGWRDHVDHERAVEWVAGLKGSGERLLFTSPIPEIGFVRVSLQRSRGQISVREAAEALTGMLGTLGPLHRFLIDDVGGGGSWPQWCRGASRTTDAHLLALAERHGLELATLDSEIPDAYLLP